MHDVASPRAGEERALRGRGVQQQLGVRIELGDLCRLDLGSSKARKARSWREPRIADGQQTRSATALRPGFGGGCPPERAPPLASAMASPASLRSSSSGAAANRKKLKLF